MQRRIQVRVLSYCLRVYYTPYQVVVPTPYRYIHYTWYLSYKISQNVLTRITYKIKHVS